MDNNTKDTLIKRYKEDGLSDIFLSHVNEIYRRNYSLQQIADVLGTSKTSVSKWLKRQYQHHPIPEQELPEPIPTPYELSEFEKSTLRTLAKKASRVSRNTPENAPSRVAAHSLENSFKYYMEKGTPISQLAKAADVSRRSIYQRLEKTK